MIDFIPLQYYTPIYHNIILLFVVITWSYTLSSSGATSGAHLFNKVFAILLFWFVVLYMGLRPVSYYFAFLMLIVSFEFWSYGTNGIRQGLATSLLLLAFSYMNKKWIMYLLFLVAFGIHSSVVIPIAAYFLTYGYRSTSFYLKLWILSIFVSLLLGSTVENYITSLGIMDEKTLTVYFDNQDFFASRFAYTGFRWDFLLYSASGVFVSYYFIFIKKFNDTYYRHLTNIYLIGNAIWILVIRANFSNRFAYLSWFMLGLIIIYPFLKQVFWKNQFSILGLVILLYFSFAYLMNFILPII